MPTTARSASGTRRLARRQNNSWLGIQFAVRPPEAGSAAMDDSNSFDVIIVGAGPAGLSAGLVLGRSRRRVAMVDSGRPRHYAALRVHNFLGHDGIDPLTQRAAGRREVEAYGVTVVDGAVERAWCASDGRFGVSLAGGKSL